MTSDEPAEDDYLDFWRAIGTALGLTVVGVIPWFVGVYTLIRWAMP